MLDESPLAMVVTQNEDGASDSFSHTRHGKKVWNHGSHNNHKQSGGGRSDGKCRGGGGRVRGGHGGGAGQQQP